MIRRFFSWLAGTAELERDLRAETRSREFLRDQFYELRADQYLLMQHLNVEFKNQPNRLVGPKK